MIFANVNMGISLQARLVLQALANREIPDHLGVSSLSTSAWYNGREQGVCVVFKNKHGLYLAVAFGECRNSDSIFVDHFPVRLHLNPPALADFTEEAYRQRQCASYLDIGHAIDIITDIVANWSVKVTA